MSARLPQPSTMVATTAMPATYATSLHPDASGRRARWLGLWLLAASVALLLLGASVGSTGVGSLLNLRGNPLAQQIVWDIRLPRTLGAWLAGALLGLAGAIAQGLFRNPLAAPYLLGSAAGAARGGAGCAVRIGARGAGCGGPRGARGAVPCAYVPGCAFMAWRSWRFS